MTWWLFNELLKGENETFGTKLKGTQGVNNEFSKGIHRHLFELNYHDDSADKISNTIPKLYHDMNLRHITPTIEKEHAWGQPKEKDALS